MAHTVMSRGVWPKISIGSFFDKNAATRSRALATSRVVGGVRGGRERARESKNRARSHSLSCGARAKARNGGSELQSIFLTLFVERRMMMIFARSL